MDSVARDATVLVQVSDIHFRAGKKSLEAIQDDVKAQLIEDAVQLCKGLPAVRGILVCGDTAFSGQKSEFVTARTWLSSLCALLGAPEENVWVVPGNHDVDRSEHSAPLLRMLHRQIRAKDPKAIDDQLDVCYKDEQSGDLLFRPLRNYNEFAASYGCSTTASSPHWEQSFSLNDGSTFVVRGMNSVLVSGDSDDEHQNRMVLGSAQCVIVAKPGREYLVMCHHPPSWLLDGHRVEECLNARARVQLFGHRHNHVINQIDDALRISSGATIPEVGNGEWCPRYNVLVLEVRKNALGRVLRVLVFARTWDPKTRTFVVEASKGVKPYSSYELELPAWDAPAKVPTSPKASPKPAGEKPSQVTIVKTTQEPTMDANRRLTYRFLLLPYYQRTEIAVKLDLARDEDRDVGETERAGLFLKRAVAAGRLADLWDEVERRHPDPATKNPFREAPK
jgi:predicted phosphodiesterase